jgi:hypothetical protein
MKRRLERQARNEGLIRRVNEEIERVDREADARGWAPEEGYFEFHCECGRGNGCDAKVRMTIEEYEVVRAQDDRFAVAPGHEEAELERVVDATDRFVVVDKRDQVEALVADDPRGARSE